MKKYNNIVIERLTSIMRDVSEDGVLPIIITHNNCADGTGVVLALAMIIDIPPGDLEVFYCQYGDDFTKIIEACNGKNVIMGDFSFSKNELIELDVVTKNILVIDHHKTAEADLSDLDYAIFDMSKSGATLTYQVCVNIINGIDLEPPELLAYVQDRDIWEWKLTDSKEISAGISTLDKGDINSWVPYLYNVSELLPIGKTILSYEDTLVNKRVKAYDKSNNKTAVFITVGDKVVPFVNTGHLISEIGNVLSTSFGMAVMYFFTHDSIVFSFRSDGSIDVSEIARKIGGGGHAKAAGCGIKFENIDLNILFKDLDLYKAIKGVSV